MAHVHVANDTKQDVHVFISKTLRWLVKDIVWDIFSLVDGLEELKLATSPEELKALPKTIHSVSDLLKTLKHCAKIRNKWETVKDDAKKAVKDFEEAFKAKSITIRPGHFEDVKAVRGLDFMSPSAVAGIFGAKTFHLIVQTDDGKKVVDFKTNHDHSWIVKDSGVVRSEYGHIWKTDPNPKHVPHPWSSESTPAPPRRVAMNNGFLLRIQNRGRDVMRFVTYGLRTYNKEEGIRSDGFISESSAADPYKHGEAPNLGVGGVYGPRDVWEVPGAKHQSPGDDFTLQIQYSLGEGSHTQPVYINFGDIPRKFARGSEMTVVVKDILHGSELQIEYPVNKIEETDPEYKTRTIWESGCMEPDHSLKARRIVGERPELDYEGFLWRVTNATGRGLTFRCFMENWVGNDGLRRPGTAAEGELQPRETYEWGEAWVDDSFNYKNGYFRVPVHVSFSDGGGGDREIECHVPNEFLHESELTVVIKDPVTDSVIQAYHPLPYAETIHATPGS